ncbi:MAG: dienelactone hydrolase family protein [Armatimonadota bacterium]|nr:dienelactone hydrolase family protein [Armatimonadota bacterium]
MIQNAALQSATDEAVSLHWLDQVPPPARCGVSWGVPWPPGKIHKEEQFTLFGPNDEPVPVQSWRLAYWPDGSVKWTGHAISAGPAISGPLRLTPGTPALPPAPLRVEEDAATIAIDTGAIQCTIRKQGSSFIESLAIGGQIVAQHGHLRCILEDRAAYESRRVIREDEFVSESASVTLEQAGPVRAVVKIEGAHQATDGERSWLPLVLRLYFFAGVDAVKMIHSFVFDGDQEKDFIRGLGVRFSVPLREEFHNRHVRLAGETGLFAEPVRLLAGRHNASPELYARQVAGQPIPTLDDLPDRANLAKMAVWDGYKLGQISADSFSIEKRTGAHSAWIHGASGQRSAGLAFVGDTTGGLAVGMKNFWQLCPTALEIENAATETAELTLWLWSPDAPAMDLRHYDVEEHDLEASYEDIEPGFSTAHGIARTTELTLCPFAATPSNAQLWALTQTSAGTPRLVCAPEYYHSIPVFGVWSLPDRSTPGKRWIEDQLDQAIAFYQGQVEQRRWYGFWDYGDVMHAYDPVRHTWRYDVGGFAWANTELAVDLWLWSGFLRTGRADVFRMAEAMTRHTQEVDVYHRGPLAGLGSRHNVRHWGCGAKEVRISQALLKRIYYYLTTDERTGDLMDEVVDADFRTVEVDPLRKLEPKTQYPTHARVGPDWFAFCSNWLAAWERTGDARYRDKIITGMKCLAAMPHQLFSGFCYGYDPQTGMLYQLHDRVEIPHLAALMGGPELCFEMTPLIDLPEWSAAWLHYCRYLQAPADEQRQALGAEVNNGRGPHYVRMTAYAALVEQDPELAMRAWQLFLRGGVRSGSQTTFVAQKIEGPDVPVSVDEVPNVSTNHTAQWCLNAIELLDMVGEHLPENDAAWAGEDQSEEKNMKAIVNTAIGGSAALAAVLASAHSVSAAEQTKTAIPASAETAQQVLKDSPRHGEWADVSLPGSETKIRTWVVYPERKDKAPVVLVIHEIFGLTDWVRAVADQLAAEGFIAVAPDLLSGKGPNGGGTESFPGDEVRNAIRNLSDDEVTQRLDAVRDYALALPAAGTTSASIGFCWGGSASFKYATRQPQLNAAVVYYGTAPTDKDALTKIAAPVLGFYGGDDARVTSTVEGTAKAMAELNKSFAPHIYDGAGHGFLRQQDGRDGANLKAAQQAWAETITFLKKNLEPPAASAGQAANTSETTQPGQMEPKNVGGAGQCH